METIYVVYFVGEGFGFHVYEEGWHKGRLYGRRSVSGPYTTKAQAEAKAEELSCVHDFTGNLAGAGMLAVRHPDWITTVRCRKCGEMIGYREATR